MEKPDATTIAWYDAAVPMDSRVVKSQMFGCPCAFVSGYMFFGTFAQTVVARVGAERAAALVEAGAARWFEPMPGRAWREYVQIDVGAVSEETLATYARDALANTAALPPKEREPKPERPKRKKG